MKRRIKLFAILVSFVLLTSCSNGIDADFGEKRRKFNDSLILGDVSLTGTELSDDFVLTVEAEDGILSGNAAVKSDGAFSGGKYVSGVNGAADMLTFNVTIESDGMYDLSFGYRTQSKDKINNVLVDGVKVGDLKCYKENEVDTSYVKNVYLSKGKHEISITSGWGWVDYDFLTVTKSIIVSQDTYKVSAPLCNPNADENTQRLYKFLCNIYGKYSLTGQFADKGRLSDEYNAILQSTGKSFAVLGLDMMNYSLINTKNGAVGEAVEQAHDWYHNAGGIVQICWHWNTHQRYIKDGCNWWNTFYADNTTFDLDKAMNGEDEKGYEYLIKDIDNVSLQLKRLCDDGVPILWRPLHEASGGWFWWGDCSPESYIKLWQLMFERMTYEHNLTNLIWMWNGQNADWYPGDDYVDIVSWDIYAGEHQYGSQSGVFAEAVSCYNETKLVALSENGTVMDPDIMFRDNARWLLWGTWNGEFVIDGNVLSEKYTQEFMLQKAYDSEYTLTLDELPNLKKYPLD